MSKKIINLPKKKPKEPKKIKTEQPQITIKKNVVVTFD